MPTTTYGEVFDTQLGTAPQSAFQAIPQATDPATTSNGQFYTRTDKGAYFKDTAGTVTSLLTAQLAASNALAGTTTTWPYGCFNATGPLLLNSGASANTLKGYIARSAGSIIGAAWMGAAPNAVNGTVQVYKNNALFFTALTGCNFPGSNGTGGPVSAVFPAGTYPYVKNDYFDVYYTGSSASLYMGVGITFSESNATANLISTVLAANTTVAATDNQRTWIASAATSYTLTLPATQSTQDFYVRVAVTGGAGVTIQAPTGVTIYKGTQASSSGGTLSLTQVGTYVTLYNPAGTSLWIVVNPSASGTLA